MMANNNTTLVYHFASLSLANLALGSIATMCRADKMSDTRISAHPHTFHHERKVVKVYENS